MNYKNYMEHFLLVFVLCWFFQFVNSTTCIRILACLGFLMPLIENNREKTGYRVLAVGSHRILQAIGIIVNTNVDAGTLTYIYWFVDPIWLFLDVMHEKKTWPDLMITVWSFLWEKRLHTNKPSLKRWSPSSSQGTPRHSLFLLLFTRLFIHVFLSSIGSISWPYST